VGVKKSEAQVRGRAVIDPFFGPVTTFQNFFGTFFGDKFEVRVFNGKVRPGSLPEYLRSPVRDCETGDLTLQPNSHGPNSHGGSKVL
jgi:hypothetical protein